MDNPVALPKPTAPSARDRALYASAVLVCLALLFFRRPDAFTAPWFYAEEGRDFFADAYRDGWASLGYRVNGYYHLYPRLVANLGLSAGLPIAGMPWLNLVAVLLMYPVVWAYTFFRLPGSAAWRCIAVLCTALVPLGNEVWMNLTNVQWPMALLIPLIAFGRRSGNSAGWRVVDLFVLVLACFTGPFALVLAPVVLLTWWLRRGADGGSVSRVHVAIVALAAAVQLVALASYGSVERTEGPFHPMDPGFLQVLFLQVWYPVLSVGVRSIPLWAQVLLSLGGIALLFHFLRKTDQARVYAWCAVSLFVATLISYRGAPGFLSPFDAGIRNFYLPTVFLAWAFASVPWSGAKRPVIIAAVVLCWWTLQTVLFIGPLRYPRPVPEIDQAALDAGRAIDVPIDPPGWTMRLENPSRE